jgi:hypothetical protein
VLEDVFHDHTRKKDVLNLPHAAPYALDVASTQMAGTVGVLSAHPGVVHAI